MKPSLFARRVLSLFQRLSQRVRKKDLTPGNSIDNLDREWIQSTCRSLVNRSLSFLEWSTRTRYHRLLFYFFPISSGGFLSDISELFSRALIGLTYLPSQDPEVSLIISQANALFKRFFLEPGIFNFNNITVDQRVVEGTSISIALLKSEGLRNQILQQPSLAKSVREFLENNLTYSVSKNNWLWFQIFHELCLHEVFEKPIKTSGIRRLLKEVLACEYNEGWYRDGQVTSTCGVDYYTPWAFQYYGILFLGFRTARDFPEEIDILQKRSKEFLSSYVDLFDSRGEAPLWGRSLIYRCAYLAPLGPALQSGLLEPEVLPNVRHIVNCAFNRFRTELIRPGLLSIGYVRPQIDLAQSYTGFGSPLWALKGFSILEVESSHPFWESKPSLSHGINARLGIRDHALGKVIESPFVTILLNQINWLEYYQPLYNRFAYTTLPGFSCHPRYRDNCIGILDDEIHWVKNLSADGIKIEIQPLTDGYELLITTDLLIPKRLIATGFLAQKNSSSRAFIKVIESSDGIKILEYRSLSCAPGWNFFAQDCVIPAVVIHVPAKREVIRISSRITISP